MERRTVTAKKQKAALFVSAVSFCLCRDARPRLLLTLLGETTVRGTRAITVLESMVKGELVSGKGRRKKEKKK